jgi:pyruvate dehydrogenase E2 component (dihydrolipoamide acetyltransferase)
VANRAGLATESPAVEPAAVRETVDRSEDGEARPRVRTEPLSRRQQLIARRMAEAKATVPHFQVQTEAEVDALLGLRVELKRGVDDDQTLPSINDFIVKACALALRRHPRANGSYRDGAFELHDQINVGVAVAAEDALIVPTIFSADERSLGEIAAQSRRLAQRVRDGTVTPPELSGATFTVSNLGMLGMTAITPVINPPQAAILGVGAARALPELVDGQLRQRHLLTLTLSCDHRILYGADAARFLSDIRRGLETPLALML